MTTLNDSSTELFKLFQDQLLQASDLDDESGRFAEFAKMARRYGGGVIQYRDATDEQRNHVDKIIRDCPNRSGFRAAVNALREETEGRATGLLELLSTIYGDIARVVGESGQKAIYETLGILPKESFLLRGEDAQKLSSVTSLTILCANDEKLAHLAVGGYLTVSLQKNTAANPHVHYGNGLLAALKHEYAWLINNYPESAMLMIQAVTASPRVLTYAELELVASGDQPLGLVEGLL